MYDLTDLIYCPPIVHMSGVEQPGYLLAWVRHDLDGSWWAVVTWTHQVGNRIERLVINTQANGLSRIDSDKAYAQVPRYRFGMDKKLVLMEPDDPDANRTGPDELGPERT